jgi:hypothetical protein
VNCIPNTINIPKGKNILATSTHKSCNFPILNEFILLIDNGMVSRAAQQPQYWKTDIYITLIYDMTSKATNNIYDPSRPIVDASVTAPAFVSAAISLLHVYILQLKIMMQSFLKYIYNTQKLLLT